MTQAALDQNVTQPALSRSIRMLEQKLKTELLERGYSGVRLTTEGRMFAEHARAIIASIRTAQDDMVAIRSGRGGRIRIGLSEAAKSRRTFQALSDIALQRDDIKMTIDFDLQDDLLAKLRRNELDAVVDFDRPDLDHDDLSFQPLMRVVMVILARAAHPAVREGGPLRELALYPWAVLDQDGAQRFFRQMFGAGGIMPDIRMQCAAPGMLRRIALERDFLILECRPVEEEISPFDGLVEVASDLPAQSFQLSMITLRRTPATIGTKRALRELAAMLAD